MQFFFDIGTYVGAIACANNQTPVEAELHITRTRRFSTSSRDVLADIAGRADDLCLADIVVGQVNDLEGVANILVIVDNLANLVDKVDDCLGHPITRSSLAAKNRHTRRQLLALFRGHGFDLQIAVNDTENVQLLTLVLVNTLDLNIKQRGWVDLYTIVLQNVLCESHLVGVLDIAELLAELLVIDKSFELVKQGEILEELVSTQFRSNQFRQLGVGLVEPPPGGDAVGDISELVRSIDLDKVLEDCCLDQIRVQLGYTIDLVRANYSQVRHAHHLGVRLFDDGHASKDIALLGETPLDELQEVIVDFIDDLTGGQKFQSLVVDSSLPGGGAAGGVA